MKKVCSIYLSGALLFGCQEERLPEQAPPIVHSTPLSKPSTISSTDLNESISTGIIPLGDILVQLELGRFTIKEINALIKESRENNRNINERVAFFMNTFRGTPFEYESQLPIPGEGVLRIRLETFGCTGFVIYTLALASAHNFEEFIQNVRVLRYWETETRGIDSHPTTGNIFDFAYELFVSNAEARGFVKDVTQEVAGTHRLTRFKTYFTARRRTDEYDADKLMIVPRLNLNKVVTAKMISQETFARMDRSKIKTGDILLFSRIDPKAQLVGETLMIGHLGIALNIDGEIYLMHATRDYMWRPDATKDTPPSATGVYYLDDPRREQLGVSAATKWNTEYIGRQLKLEGKSYFGYHPTEKRPLYDYMSGAKITGVMVLRPIERSTHERGKTSI